MNITMSKPEFQQTTEDWEAYIVDLAEQRLAYYGLDAQDWIVKFIDRDEEGDIGFAAYSWARGRVIILTREYLLNTDERNVEETILHEIAHALTSGEHDEAWKAKLEEIGGTGLWYDVDGTATPYPVLTPTI